MSALESLKKSKFLRNLGFALFLLTICYPLTIYVCLVSRTQAAEIKGSGAGTATSTGQSTTASTAASVGSKNDGNASGLVKGGLSDKGVANNGISLGVDGELLKRVEELARYAALVDYLKIFFPVFSFLVVGVFASLGYYFVQSQVLSATANSTRELSTKADRAETAMKAAEKALQQAREQIASLEQSMEELIALRLDGALVGIDHAMSVTNWRLMGFDDAILYGRRNVERLNNLITRMETRFVRFGASPNNSTNAAEKERLEAFKAYRPTALASLAYYYTDRYRERKNEADRIEALQLARQLPDSIESVEAGERLNIVDCYLFALSPSSEVLLKSEKDMFATLFIEYSQALQRMLSSTDKDKSIYEDYVRIAKGFRNDTLSGAA